MIVFTLAIAFLPFPLSAVIPDIQENFVSIPMRNIDIASFGVNVGHLDQPSCSIACITHGSICNAFHRSSDGTCYVIAKSGEFWSMRAGVPSTVVWVRAGKLNPNCTSNTFPFYHGASRYRYEHTTRTWTEQRSHCESLSSKLTELMTNAERSLVSANLLATASGLRDEIFVGLIQPAGSSEPSGGWEWYVSKVAMSMPWEDGEPNEHYGRNENVGTLKKSSFKFNDRRGSQAMAAICECSVIV